MTSRNPPDRHFLLPEYQDSVMRDNGYDQNYHNLSYKIVSIRRILSLYLF